MAFIFKLTAEGRNALINATHDGLAARTVASVGITATAIVPGDPIAGEIKRISTIAGDVVAADTIHVTVRDDTEDAYTIRGFGLYLESGVLLGSYGQADPIINKTSASIMLLSADARILDGSVDITTLVFGDASFANPQATTERRGIIEIATVAEVKAGASAELAVTPATLMAAMGNRMPFFTAAEPLPAENIGPIWHEAYQSIMTWRVFNANGAAFTGYASIDIGWLRPDTQPTPRDAWVKTGVTGLPTTMTLYHWAKHNGLMLTAGWTPGTLFYKDNEDGTFVTPDVRGEHPRFWDDTRGADAGRAFGSWQGDAMRNITGSFHAVRTSWHADGVFFQDGWQVNGSDSGGVLTPVVQFSAARQVPTASEIRGRNTTFAGVIHI